MNMYVRMESVFVNFTTRQRIILANEILDALRFEKTENRTKKTTVNISITLSFFIHFVLDSGDKAC